MKTTVLNVRIGVKDLRELAAAAEEERLSTSSFARSLILTGLRRRGDRSAEAQELLDHIEENPRLLFRLRRLLLFTPEESA